MDSTWGGDWTVKAYVNTAEYAEHLVLVKGRIEPDKPTLVRMHAINIFQDLLAEANGRAGQLARSMQMIGQAGAGVVVVIRDTRSHRLTELMRKRAGQPVAEAEGGASPLRDYGIGAQILLDLGVRDMILLSNTRHNIVGLEGYGLNIVEQRPIPLP